jgi:hypothetical protein
VLGAAWDAASPVGAGPAAAGVALPAQAMAIRALQDSPPMAAQRRRMRAAFGPRHVPDEAAPAQRQADAPAQRAGDEPIKSSEVADGEDGEYVLIELNPGARLPRAADVADMLDRDGLARDRAKEDKDREPLQLDDFEEAVQDALARAPAGSPRGSEVRLRGLKNGRVEVHAAGGDAPAQVIVGPFPPGTLEDRAEYSEEDLLFSDNAAASADHGAITDTAAGSGPSPWAR